MNLYLNFEKYMSFAKIVMLWLRFYSGENTLILVEFADVKHTTNHEDTYNEAFGQMNGYFRNLSCNAVSISGKGCQDSGQD